MPTPRKGCGHRQRWRPRRPCPVCAAQHRIAAACIFPGMAPDWMPAMSIVLATLSLAAFSSGAAAEAPADPIAHLRSGHPRLLFTDGQLADALEAAKADPPRAALHARIVAAAPTGLSSRPPVRELQA